MNVFTKAKLFHHVLRWRMNWNKRDTRYKFSVPDNPRFMSAREAVGLIQDGDVIATSGLAGNQRVAVMYWAIRELFDECGRPKNLTMVCTGGQGSRGRVPGSMEELGVPGLCTCLVTGHHETFKSLLRLAAKGRLQMQCIPQGIVAFLMEAQSKGQDSILTTTGVGTFIDPRVGGGTALFNPKAPQLVSVEGDRLRYTMPKINVAMFGAPAADREGNIYLKHASVIAETHEIVKAAKFNGGRVIVNVGRIVEKGYADIDIPAESVDAVVHDPRCEQVISIKHTKYWPMLTTESDIPVSEAILRVRYINRLLKITPKRAAIDDALARLAATIVAAHAAPGIMLNIGVGLPEEVCRVMDEAGLLNKVTVFTESGVIGGIPAPGVFFGAAVCPKKMVSSAEIFRICKQGLDIAVLGVVEADEKGNVNVSKRGDDPRNYVGPGGFIDITGAAKTIVFVTAWMAHAEIGIVDGKIKIIKPGKPKFVPAVSEITFSGEQAIKNGKNVYYVTNVGVFQLTAKGIRLISVMPGIDIQKDIIGATSAKILLPDSGNVPVADPAVITGKNFKLDFKSAPSPSVAAV